MTDYIPFREDNYDDENNLLQAMLELKRKKDDFNVNKKKWHSV